MPSSGLGAYQVKIHQILFGGLFFLAVLGGVRGMMFGGSGNVKMLAAASLAIACVLLLDSFYWLLAPILITIGLQIPGLPFDGIELGCVTLVVVYFVRSAMHKEHPIKINRNLLIAFPLLSWILLIWILNPTGMNILGSTTIGARFYFKIAVGASALCVLSTLRLSETDCRILFVCLLMGSLYAFISSIVGHQIRSMELPSQDSARAAASQYHLLGALSLYLLMMSRNSLSRLLTSLSKLILTFLFALFVLFSGKRQGLGTLLITPYLRVFITRRDVFATFICSCLLVLFITVSVAGHGFLWDLPPSAQRGLSVFVPEFKTLSAMGASDIFRDNMKRVGYEFVRSNPWLGRKGYAMSREETRWIWISSGLSFDSQFQGHAFSGNWHNLWLAFACDFGIPGLILFAFFGATMMLVVLPMYRYCPRNSYIEACYLFYAYQLCTRFIFASVAGHSSISLQDIFVKYGLILAITNGARLARQQKNLLAEPVVERGVSA